MFSMRVFFATVLGSSRGMPVMSLTFQRSPRGDIANGCIVSPNTSYNLFFFFMVRWGQDRLMGREIPESVSTYAYDGHHPPLYIQHIKHTPGSQTCPPNVLLWHGRPLSPAPTLQNTNILSIIVFPSFFFFFLGFSFFSSTIFESVPLLLSDPHHSATRSSFHPFGKHPRICTARSHLPLFRGIAFVLSRLAPSPFSRTCTV